LLAAVAAQGVVAGCGRPKSRAAFEGRYRLLSHVRNPTGCSPGGLGDASDSGQTFRLVRSRFFGATVMKSKVCAAPQDEICAIEGGLTEPFGFLSQVESGVWGADLVSEVAGEPASCSFVYTRVRIRWTEAGRIEVRAERRRGQTPVERCDVAEDTSLAEAGARLPCVGLELWSAEKL